METTLATNRKKKLQAKARLLTAITYRAQRNSAGYFAGYMSKRQGVGRFELAQANKNLAWLKEKLQEKSNSYQLQTFLKSSILLWTNNLKEHSKLREFRRH